MLFCTMAILLCLVACNKKDEPQDINSQTLAKHWVGDSTDVMFDVNGNVMTPDSFSNYLDDHKMIASLVGEKYLPYIKSVSEVKITDLVLNRDYTYDLTVKNSKSTKNASGTWVEVNDVLTLNLNLKDVLDIEREGAMDFTVEKLTKNNIELSGKLELLTADVSGITAGAILTFTAHAAN